MCRPYRQSRPGQLSKWSLGFRTMLIVTFRPVRVEATRPAGLPIARRSGSAQQAGIRQPGNRQP